MHRLLLASILLAGVAAGESAEAVVGDTRRVSFVLPFPKAFAQAKAAKRLLFLKPIYGGVDARGAVDYRCGSW